MFLDYLGQITGDDQISPERGQNGLNMTIFRPFLGQKGAKTGVGNGLKRVKNKKTGQVLYPPSKKRPYLTLFRVNL